MQGENHFFFSFPLAKWNCNFNYFFLGVRYSITVFRWIEFQKIPKKIQNFVLPRAMESPACGEQNIFDTSIKGKQFSDVEIKSLTELYSHYMPKTNNCIRHHPWTWTLWHHVVGIKIAWYIIALKIVSNATLTRCFSDDQTNKTRALCELKRKVSNDCNYAGNKMIIDLLGFPNLLVQKGEARVDGNLKNVATSRI